MNLNSIISSFLVHGSHHVGRRFKVISESTGMDPGTYEVTYANLYHYTTPCDESKLTYHVNFDWFNSGWVKWVK